MLGMTPLVAPTATSTAIPVIPAMMPMQPLQQMHPMQQMQPLIQPAMVPTNLALSGQTTNQPVIAMNVVPMGIMSPPGQQTIISSSSFDGSKPNTPDSSKMLSQRAASVSSKDSP